MSEREVAGTRERLLLSGDHLYVFQVLIFVPILSMRKLRGFLLYGFPEENSLRLLSLVIITVHVILSNKILRSYCLNDKNLIDRTQKKLSKVEEKNCPQKVSL